jgi:hypothetical protein
MNSIRKTQIYVNSREVGKVTGTTFVKAISGSKHFLRSPQAIAHAITALEDAEKAGATSIQVTDLETGLIYTAAFDYFREHGFDVNRGYEPQIAMRLENWNITGGKVTHQIEKNKKVQPVKQSNDKTTAPAQMAFDIFGGARR